MTGHLVAPTSSIMFGFLAASLAMNLTPGLDMVFVMGEAFKGGARSGRWAALGIAGGSLCHAVLAALGLVALLAAVPRALTVLTYAGGLYLVYLGVRMVCRPASARPPDVLAGEGPVGMAATRPARIFGRGVLVNLLNIKVVLFYLTFLPQFVRPDQGPVWQQVLLFGLTFNILGTAVLLLVATASGRVARVTAHPDVTTAMSRIAGLVLIALALGLLWTRFTGGAN